MKNLAAIKKLLPWAVLLAVMSGCVIDPVQRDSELDIKGAPDWVNKGSMIVVNKEVRIFRGVDSAATQGDMALQKSIADDRSIAETTRVLSNYLDVVSNEYMESARVRESGASEEVMARHIEETAARQIKEGIARQLDDAIARQFKEPVSPKFKEDISRHVREDALRYINEAVSTQIDFAHQMETVIARQIKEAVARQIKSATKTHVSGAKIITNWRDPRTGTIWSLSELDMKHVRTAMAGSNDMNSDLKRYFDINADLIFDRATGDRPGMFPFGYK